MATIPLPIHQMIAVLDMPRGYSARLDRSQAILQQCTGNANVTFTPGQITAMTNLIATFEARQIDVGARLPNAVAERNAAYKPVYTMLKEWRGIVQIAADADPANAEIIIESCGMKVKTVTIVGKHAFSAKNNEVSGVVDLRASRVPKTLAHEWSTSANNAAWNSLPSTAKVKTQVTGLTPQSKVYFRHRVLNRVGYTAWEYTNLVIS